MPDANVLLSAAGITVTAIGTGWTIYSATRKPPFAVITRNGSPASDVVLIGEDGLETTPHSRTGNVQFPKTYIGTWVIIRDAKSGLELHRFIVRSGRNEVIL